MRIQNYTVATRNKAVNTRHLCFHFLIIIDNHSLCAVCVFIDVIKCLLFSIGCVVIGWCRIRQITQYGTLTLVLIMTASVREYVTVVRDYE